MAEPQHANDTLARHPNGTRRSGTTSQTSTLSRARSKRASDAGAIPSGSKQNGGASLSSAAFPIVEKSSPSSAPQNIPRTPRTASEPGLRSVLEKSGLETPMNNKGKRKAEEVDITPPDQRAHHATFVIPTEGRRSHHVSEVSRAPSSFAGRKRARLSSQSPSSTPSRSQSQTRPSSATRHLTDSWPSRTSIPAPSLHRALSKTASMRSGRPDSRRSGAPDLANGYRQAESRRSMSELSFPISALVAPHAPSVSVRSGGYYMRDPRKPPRVQATGWTLRFNSREEQGSPLHAWAFFIGFVLFPLWWIASFWRIPQTRRVGGTDTEKAVTLDDPQVEHDARSWRTRCRVMLVVSLLTYIPFIVLLVVFVPRG
ncbi:uncharacterized protein BXZ73DRAFT_46799 [Epithele typhae]|uniref:uncharacterized protein n=1 Tax=Epithele typhae TaxID=378194 RepID=UPI0020073CDB|nr:uncharacterized protein BXZ73DRAFT_46799 [Epithele typhae]KAH9932730.1 hypothetical protein BXZ73DRAFT_46799 [Epithele typhae]